MQIKREPFLGRRAGLVHREWCAEKSVTPVCRDVIYSTTVQVMISILKEVLLYLKKCACL